MNDLTDQQLLREYAEQRAEAAFTELVRRHVDHVYSAAIRLVQDAHLAQDVTQGVFVALAGHARQLAGHPVLSGWLHTTARNLAAKTVRTDVRRRNREKEATAMNELLAAGSEPSWDELTPHLDAAMGELSETDRDALMLRYFEKKSALEMAVVLDISDEAAQKRVNRAVERLRETLSKRQVTVGAGGLVVLISANAVQSAPVGLTATISTAALAGAAAVTSSTLIASTQTIVMTTLQKAAVTAALAILAGAGIYEAHQNSHLLEANRALQQQQAPLTDQVRQLQQRLEQTSNQLADVKNDLAAAGKRPAELMKLRGEVGRLSQEKSQAGEKSALNKITADPETRKMLRDQQKVGMSQLYNDYIKKLKLPAEQAGKFNDMLADNVMDNVDLITQVLHDGKSQAEIDKTFSDADAAFLEKVRDLLGDEAAQKYQDYTKSLSTKMMVAQYAGYLTGDKEAKQAKQDQLTAAFQTETAAALQTAGLPADYQVVPMLNFRNIASETEGEQSLALLDGILSKVADNMGSVLTPEEMTGLQTYRTNAVSISRTQLMMNRKMMAPLNQ